MQGREQATVEIELSLDPEPVRGSVRDAEGERRPFYGWLALLTALYDARRPRSRRSESNGRHES